jgi:anaerobic selenocysteine-containing dehydrogenase
MNLQQAQNIARLRGETVVPTVCGMCGPGGPGGGCGIYAFVKDGRFVRVAGMDESPVNRGAVCAKGHAAPQWVYSPDRLTTPLKRTGAKGEGQFTAITWQEAIEEIAEKLTEQKKRFGPESLAILAPSKRSYNDYLKRFLTVHGSPNYGHSGICAMQRAFAFFYTLGDYPRPDYREAELIIYWGRQPVFSGPVARPAKAFLAARRRGAKIVAIKPSVEPDVSLADLWIPIRPGTDTALALAMLHVIIGEDLVDHDFINRWCYGFAELQEHVRRFDPAWAEQICGVPAQQIADLARLYATTPKATIDLGNGVEHTPSSNDAIRAVAHLIAITGHLDRPGGNLFVATPPEKPLDISLKKRYRQELVDKCLGPEFPLVFQPFMEGISSAYYRIFESVLNEKPYPIRTIIAPGTQPAASTRGTRNVIAALKKLDFFVIADVARTAEMAYADIVMPLATGYETNHPFQHVPGWLMATNQIIEPVGSGKSIIDFFLDLGVAMGYGDDFWCGDVERAMAEQLAPLHLTMQDLREKVHGIALNSPPQEFEKYQATFTRPSPRLDHAPFLPQGKVALNNTTFAAAGFTPLPEWREPPESLSGTPELVDQFPLILSDYHTSKNLDRKSVV